MYIYLFRDQSKVKYDVVRRDTAEKNILWLGNQCTEQLQSNQEKLKGDEIRTCFRR